MKLGWIVASGPGHEQALNDSNGSRTRFYPSARPFNAQHPLCSKPAMIYSVRSESAR